MTDAMVEEVLQKVNLADAAVRLGGLRNAERPLAAILSLGEQQVHVCVLCSAFFDAAAA